MGQDALTLQKAEVFAHIASAIASTGFVEASVFETQDVVPAKEELETIVKEEPKGKASLERKPEPKKVVGTAKIEVPTPPAPTPEWLSSKEFMSLHDLSEESEENRKARVDYLIQNYGDKPMRSLPTETFAYFHLEKQELDNMKYYLSIWKEDAEQWMIKAASEISKNRVTSIGELTVEEYLKKLIPAVWNLNYILSFEEDQHDELMAVLSKVSKGTVQKIGDLYFPSIEFIRMSVDKVIDGTYDDIEKVS